MAKTAVFGTTQKGEKITLYTIKNAKGMEADITDYGAILVSLRVPDKNGKTDDVVLGFDKAEGYFENGCYLGSTVGRCANRVAGAAFELGGKIYKLSKNEGENNLHSGPDGYNNRLFTVKDSKAEDSVTFYLESPDGDQGYPGNLKFWVTYTVTADNALSIKYEAESDADTVFNPTNHTYFNLSGHKAGTAAAMSHKLTLAAEQYTPVRPDSIPTGKLASVIGTPMDFRKPMAIGKRIEEPFEQLKLTGGYDHNFVLEVRSNEPERVAELTNAEQTRTMTVYTDCPGIQFYAGNFITDQVGKEAYLYTKRCGVCLETQYFPNSINEDGFKSPILRKGEHYKSVTAYVFS